MVECPYCGSENCSSDDGVSWYCSDCDEEFEDFESNEGMLDNLDDEQYNFLELSDNLDEELDTDWDDDMSDDIDDDYEDAYDDDYDEFDDY